MAVAWWPGRASTTCFATPTTESPLVSNYLAFLLSFRPQIPPVTPNVVWQAAEVIIFLTACRTLSTAEKLRDGRDRVTAISLDVQQPTELDRHIADHDVVISLVPFIYHVDVVKSAIKSKTNVVTTSYVSPAMRELDASIKEAGITVLNEVGMDPGVDHLYAVKTIDEVHEKGGKVRCPLCISKDYHG